MTRSLTQSLIDTLTAGGLTVGDATGEGLTPPFVVVYPIAGETFDGTVGDTWSEVDKPFQPTCVGADRWQAEWLADRVRDLLLEATGVTWRARPLPGGGVARDDETGGPPQFLAYPRFVLNSWLPA